MHPLLEKLMAEINKLPPNEQDAVLTRLLREVPTAANDKKSTGLVDISWRI